MRRYICIWHSMYLISSQQAAASFYELGCGGVAFLSGDWNSLYLPFCSSRWSLWDCNRPTSHFVFSFSFQGRHFGQCNTYEHVSLVSFFACVRDGEHYHSIRAHTYYGYLSAVWSVTGWARRWDGPGLGGEREVLSAQLVFDAEEMGMGIYHGFEVGSG